MMYPLVRELAVEGIPVTVTCRVLKLARQPYYRWLGSPVGRRELDRAYLTNAVSDAHTDDPEYGYLLLADEAPQAGEVGCDRALWRICRDQQWWSAFGSYTARTARSQACPPTTTRCSASSAPIGANELWLTDTSEGKL